MLIVSVLLLNGCRKDDDDAVILYALLSEQPGSNSKIYIDDLYACWENNDQIKINDTPYSVVVTDDAEALGGRKAAIYTVTTASTFTAAYPSDYVTNCNGGSVTLEIPSAQTYNNDAIDGKQNIVAPCVGYSGDLDFHDDHTAEEPLIMRNVGGLLHVTVENNLSQTLTLYAIEVESSVAYIAGTGDIDASSSEPSITLREHKSKSITLHCNASNISLGPSECKDFYMVVAPFSEATKFTVHVLATGNGDSKKYTFHRESNSNITIGRNQLGNITTKLDAAHTTGTERLFWGQGTESCPYMITCYADLDLLRKVVNYDAPFNTSDYQTTYNRNSVHYIQTADIDIKTGSGMDTNNWGWYVSPNNYRPIGYSTTQYFQANYNGMYHKVSGLSLNCGEKNPSGDIGLFGVIGGGAKIHKLAVSGWIQNTKADIHIGGIVGHAYLNCSIEECTNETNIYTNALSTDLNRNSYGIGGICGACTYAEIRTIKNCVNRGHIYTVGTCTYSYTNVNMGGILGYNACDGTTVQECSNYGAIESLNAISKYGTCGGICGVTVRRMTIANCENHGRITNYYNGSTEIYNGGILAKVDHTGADVKINSCTNNSIVNVPSCTSAKTGGIVGGSANNYSLTISLCTNTGAVSGNGNTGGIIGYANNSGKLNVNSCINTTNGILNGGYGTGGLIGYTNLETYLYGTITNNGAVSGASTPNGGVGGIVGFAVSLDINNTWDGTTINNGNVTSSGDGCTGGIVGNIAGTSTINKCKNSAIVSSTKTSSDYGTGGIIGDFRAGATLTVKNCGNEGNVTHNNVTTDGYSSGIVGFIYAGASVSCTTYVNNCYCQANITGKYASGIATLKKNGTQLRFYMDNCYYSGTINGSSNGIGPLLFLETATNKGSYTYCYTDNTTTPTPNDNEGNFSAQGSYKPARTFNPATGLYTARGSAIAESEWNTGDKLLDKLNGQATNANYAVGWKNDILPILNCF